MNRAFISAFLALMSGASVGVSSAHSQENDWLLSPDRAANLKIGATVNELYKQFGRANVRLVDLQREGLFDPALQIPTVTSRDPTGEEVLCVWTRGP